MASNAAKRRKVLRWDRWSQRVAGDTDGAYLRTPPGHSRAVGQLWRATRSLALTPAARACSDRG